MKKLLARCILILTLISSIAAGAAQLNVCSFNIQFLGNGTMRDDKALAEAIKSFDIVVVQELVAPPYPGQFPDGTAFRPKPKSAKFFDAMKQRGFTYWLSEEDTGKTTNIHNNSSATEWFVAFYKTNALKVATDLPHGFLHPVHGHNPDFDRVPYAFSFRTQDAKMDFVLISVHLRPDSSGKAWRKHELATIGTWVQTHSQKEKDFIILGDMNIENAAELLADLPPGFRSLNDGCVPTNTNVNGPRPYDHVMFLPAHTGREIDSTFGFKVLNLIAAMKPLWHSSLPYPGNPYSHDKFRAWYSDHHPVYFRMISPATDDD
jgi:endonuclease/exonuclease/phosphatase family metal-dependent hydrolase